jgi:hypothetical protein
MMMNEMKNDNEHAVTSNLLHLAALRPSLIQQCAITPLSEARKKEAPKQLQCIIII